MQSLANFDIDKLQEQNGEIGYYNNFVTKMGKELPHDFVLDVSRAIVRNNTILLLLNEIPDANIVTQIGDSIFEFTVTYVKNNDCVRQLYQSTYDDKLNEIIRILRDESAHVKQKLLNGEFDPRRVAFMKSHQYNPGAWKSYFDKQEIREKKEKNRETVDLYTCSRCKGNKHQTMQLQTRSSDEPMTTFVTCVTCGFTFRE